jgi:hypothetical protein
MVCWLHNINHHGRGSHSRPLAAQPCCFHQLTALYILTRLQLPCGFPHAAHKSMGLIPALCQSLRDCSISWSLRTDWATPAFNRGNQGVGICRGATVPNLATRMRTASGAGPGMRPPTVSDMLHAHMSIEAALLSQVVMMFGQCCHAWVQYLCSWLFCLL